jgi:ABC-type transport system involved in multi-copper enzyme maturation permease subunit
MSLGPFFKRELLTSSWRSGVFRHRVITPAVLAIVFAVLVLGWPRSGRDWSTVSGWSRFGLTAFALLVTAMAFLAMALAIAEIAPAIAGQRDKKTLELLLTTRLTSGEIVLVTLAARLVRCVAWLAAMAPVVVLVVVWSGVDPLLAALCGACLLSWVFALAALSVVSSVYAPTAARACSFSVLLITAWIALPISAYFVLPRLWPTASRVAMPAILWVIDSSPIAPVAHLMGTIRRATFLEALLWMMVLQLGGAFLLIALAISRLRPASRDLSEGDARSRVLRALRARWMRRPGCWDDPILWYELHSTRGMSRVDRASDRVIRILLVGLFAWLVVAFAVPAFQELAERGYSASAGKPSLPEYHPLARLLVTKLSNLGNTLVPGQARLEFNIILRQSSAVISFLAMIMLSGAAAETIVVERERDTWLGVIATPLSGAEILPSKILGALWRIRDCVGALLGLWLVGLLSGALHPLGLVAALVSLGAAISFYVVWGTYTSLWAGSRGTAMNRTLPLAILFPMSAAFLYLAIQPAFRCALTAGSVPLLTWSALLSYDDVAAMCDSGAFPQVAAFRIPMPPSAFELIATWILGTTVYALGAFLIGRAVFRGFDAAVDRPRRNSSSRIGRDRPNSIAEPNMS